MYSAMLSDRRVTDCLMTWIQAVRWLLRACVHLPLRWKWRWLIELYQTMNKSEYLEYIELEQREKDLRSALLSWASALWQPYTFKHTHTHIQSMQNIPTSGLSVCTGQNWGGRDNSTQQHGGLQWRSALPSSGQAGVLRRPSLVHSHFICKCFVWQAASGRVQHWCKQVCNLGEPVSVCLGV